MNKEELLYNEIYERTQNFGRTQFVREIMRLQRENKELQQKVNQLETNIDEAIELLTKSFNFCENDSQGEFDICNIAINREKKAIEILRRGKEC